MDLSFLLAGSGKSMTSFFSLSFSVQKYQKGTSFRGAWVKINAKWLTDKPS